MKKIFLFLFFIHAYLLAKPLPYTLENLQKLNLYYVDKSGLFSKKDQGEIKQNIQDKLKKSGFDLNATDPSTLVIIINTIDIEDSVIANISLLVGEEVVTKRKNNIETMALTYHESNFLELDEPVQEIKENIYQLVENFLQLYKEDME